MKRILLPSKIGCFRRFLTLLLALLLVISTNVQAKSQDKAVIGFKNASLPEAFHEIETVFHVRFFYNPDAIDPKEKITLVKKERTLPQLLEEFSVKAGLKFKQVGNMIGVQLALQPVAPTNQAMIITGIVTDKEGKPLMGVTVRNENTQQGTVTDQDGRYSLSASPGDALDFSFVGYIKKVVKVGNINSINIGLEQNTSMLNEMVVTGYTTKSIGEITGSLQQISGAEVRKGVTSSDVTAMLKGKVTGLYISSQSEADPTSSAQIVVRGQSSIQGIGIDPYNEYVVPTINYGPLLVLDGVITPATNLKDLVNPEDIESISFLKDAASTAIYGSRAAAGVIVVTTKRGKAGEMGVNLNIKYGMNIPNRGNARLMSGMELYNAQKEYFSEDYGINQANYVGQYPTLQDYLNFTLPSLKQVQDSSFDYEKYAFIRSQTKEVNLSVSGGTEKTKYYAGIGYYDEQATGIENELARKTFRFNLDNTFNKHFSFSASLNGIFDDGTKDNNNSSAIGSIYQIPPWIYPYNADGSPKAVLNFNIGGNPSTSNNFLYDKRYNYNTIRNQQLFGSLKLNWNITDWLSASTTNSFTLGYGKNETYTDARTYAGYAYLSSTGLSGALNDAYTYDNSLLTSNLLNFHKTFGDHSLRALAGEEFGKTVSESDGANLVGLQPGYHVINVAQNIGSLYGYDLGQKPGNVTGDEFDKVIFSAFGELGYNYKEKYFASGSVRTDASTSFGKNKRYGTFYSGGVSWLLNEEAFLKESRLVNLLKLRANYGTSGAQTGNDYLTQTLYDLRFQYSGQSAAPVASLANPDIGWETTKTLSTGIDFGFLNNRITGSADYYDRRSVGLIQKATLTAAIGAPGQFQNVATVQNKGLEIMLNTENIKSGNFNWNTNFNISFNKNRLLKAAGDSLYVGADLDFYIHPGEDVNIVKAVKYAGVDPQSGHALYQELIFDAAGKVTGTKNVQDANQVLTDGGNREKQVLGTTTPKFFGGMTNSFSYKNFTLSVLLYFVYGDEMLNNYARDFQGNSITYYNQLAYVKGQVIWDQPGQTNATEPSRYWQVNDGSYFGVLHSHFYVDGSYLRIRNVRLSYDLSQSLLKKVKIPSAELYLSGDNLHTFTRKGFIGADPEGPYVGGGYFNLQSVGYGLGAPRRYLFGLNVTF